MEKIVIAAASYYNKNYYFAHELNHLPLDVKREIKSMTIEAAEKSRGVFSVGINKTGEIVLETGGAPEDLNYDEIEGKLQIKRLEKEKAELFMKLALWYSRTTLNTTLMRNEEMSENFEKRG